MQSVKYYTQKLSVNFNYTMDNVIVERCKSIKDIGVEIDNKLNWNTHIQTIVKKGNKVMGLIKRTVGYKAPMIVKKKQLYIALVRSCLEYYSSVWNGTTQRNILILERIQRAATRYILQRPEFNYKERLLELGILPLTFRREYLDLCMFFKCMKNVYDFNISDHITFTNVNKQATRSTIDGIKLKIPVTKTLMYQKLYFNRIVFLWNKLPLDIRCQTKFNLFKSRLHSYFAYLLENTFNSDNICTWSLNCRCLNCKQI